MRAGVGLHGLQLWVRGVTLARSQLGGRSELTGGRERMTTECKCSSGLERAYCVSVPPGATQIRKRLSPDLREGKGPVRGTHLQADRTQCWKRRKCSICRAARPWRTTSSPGQAGVRRRKQKEQ